MIRILVNCNVIIIVIFLILGITVSKVEADDCPLMKEIIENFGSFISYDFKDDNCCKNTYSMEVQCDNDKNVTGIKLKTQLLFIADMSKANELMKKLPKLEYFEFDNVHSDGVPYEFPQGFGNLPNLKTLVIKDCGKKFKGEEGFPDIFEGLVNLERLELIKNNFKGSIPKSIGNLKKLKHLIIENSQVTGYLPYEFRNLESLEELKIVENKELHGYVPPLPNLKTCDYGLTELCSLSNSKCKSNSECTKDIILETNKEINNPNEKEFENEGIGFFKKIYFKIKNFLDYRKVFKHDSDEKTWVRVTRFFVFFFLVIMLFMLAVYLCVGFSTYIDDISKCKDVIRRNLKDNDSDYESVDSRSNYSDEDSDIYIDSNSNNYNYNNNNNNNNTNNNNNNNNYNNNDSNSTSSDSIQINVNNLNVDQMFERLIHRQT